MPVLSDLNFTYAGQNSTDMGVFLVAPINASTGLPYAEPFIGDRTILETTIRGNDKNYYSGIQRQPLVLNLNLAFKNPLNDQTLRSVARWLEQPSYQPFYTSSNPDRIFYCMPTTGNILNHTGVNGIVSLQMRCDSPYSYSPIYTSPVLDYSTNDPTNGSSYKFTNNGDTTCYPECWIWKVGSGNVQIINDSNSGLNFQFTGLNDGEEIYVNNEREDIQSSLEPQTYRFSSFNNNFLEMVYGVNNLQIYGNCKIQFRYEFRTLQGAGIIS